MAVILSSSSSLFFISSSPIEHQQQQPMLYSLFLIISLFLLFILMFKRLKKTKVEDEKSSQTQTLLSIFRCSLSSTINKTHQTNKTTHPLFLEILTSNPPKLVSLISSLSSHFSVDGNSSDVGDNGFSNGLELDNDGGGDSVGDNLGKSGDQSGKKKKKRAKKKRHNSQSEDVGEDPSLESQLLASKDKHCLDCLYPFTSSSSVTQRKIKQQYDQLVKSHDSKGLTLVQVCQFVNCLIEARNDLQHKSEIIQRKFTISKALLFKADRSSFDRLSQQIYKLEAEQKRLEEDAVVYNRLQQQLKLSPAYKKMLEICARMESKASSGQPVESPDDEFSDISFEELLAQEKKDTFWQRNGKLRSCTN